MMNYPLKKRRGRPPKYLSIWQHQHNNNNTMTEHNNGHTMNVVCDVDIGHVIDMSKGKAENKDYVNNDKNNNNNNNNNGNVSSNGWENSSKDDNCCSDTRGVNDIQDKATSSGDASNIQDPRDQPHQDQCSGTAPVHNTDSTPEIRQPNRDNTRQQTATPSEQWSHHPSSVPANSSRSDPRSDHMDLNADPNVAKSDQNHEGQTLNLSENADRECHVLDTRQPPGEGSTDATSFAAESRQPMKRRPGRPPGSTKKARTIFPPFLKTAGNEDEFSLRRFFEAGGRDYHEYLEWLKTKRTAMPSPPQMPLIIPPFCQLPLTGNNVRMTSQGFPFPAAPIYRPQVHLLASIRPAATAVVSPVTSQPSAANEEKTISNTGTLGNLNFMSQQAPFGYRCFTCKPKVPVVDAPKKQTPRSEAYVLDLSAKRTRHNSDSEKENDCLDMSLNKRQKNDNGQTVRSDPPDNVLTADKQKMEIDGEHVTDDLVESSTESDVTTSWSVDQVANFVARVPECHVYAEVFRTHRIDGTTLPHLSDDHLLNHVGMKLGHMIHLRLALSRLKSEK